MNDPEPEQPQLPPELWDWRHTHTHTRAAAARPDRPNIEGTHTVNRKLIIPTAAVLLVAGLSAMAARGGGVDAAHIPDHGAGCDGITVSGTKYTQGGTVDLTIGTSHAHHAFAGPTFSYSLTNPDRTHAEPWTIVIVSNAGDGSATYEGTVQPCESPSTSTSTVTVASSTTTAPPTPSSTTTVAPATTVASGPTSPPPIAPAGPPATDGPTPSSTTSTPEVAVAAPPVRRPTANTLPVTL